MLTLAMSLTAQTTTAPAAPAPVDPTAAPASTSFAPQWLLGSGAGFKPYQTSIKAGSSAFVEGGWQFTPGMFAFTRVDLRSTDAQMVSEGCKTVFAKASTALMICGGAGFGVDATNVGISLAAGGKWFFAPKLLQKQNAWVSVEIGIDRNTVPAPASSSGNVNPVQPDFRFGIFKAF